MMSMIRMATILISLFALAEFYLPAQSQGTFTDPRDKQVYQTITWQIKSDQDSVSEVTWMAQNLNFRHPGSACFNNDAENCEAFGRLYTFTAAMEGCPPGWNLPTNDQWQELTDRFGGKAKAGKKLKSKSKLWLGSRPEVESPYLGVQRYAGNNKSGFSVIPAGVGTPETGFFKFGLSAVFWSSTSLSELMASDWIFSVSSTQVVNSEANKHTTGNAVRCIKTQ